MSEILIHKDSLDLSGIGGKASNLAKLNKMGFRIPKWAVIPEEILLKQLPSEGDVEAIKQAFQSLVLPENLEHELSSFFGKDFNQKSYAVRSSAADEDGSTHSFAGQFETYLHVPFSQLGEKIIAIWRSVASERVLTYRKGNKLKLQFGIGVIIQEMINSDVAGVGFGADPISGDTETKVISAVFGLGEGLVSGKLNADHFTISRKGIKREIAEKTHAFVAKPEHSGVIQIALDAEKQHASTLSDTQVNTVCDALEKLNKQLGSPQDIEFAFYQNEFYLLQTRPITTLGKSSQGEYILWDNSNIIESYPGITTPLTFSFIIKMYEMVYRQFVGLLGVKEPEIEQHKDVFANTLGLVRGRVYYNLLSWYKMLAMVPGYSINARFMETMMGVDERFDLKENMGMSKGRAWFRIFEMVINMVRLQRALPKERTRFLAHLEKTINAYKAINFERLSPKEIVTNYNSFEQNLLLQWKAPLINDFFAMIWFGMLQKQAAKLCPEAPNVHNDLLCGSQDIISVQPIHRSIEIAKRVQGNASEKALFLNHSSEEIWNEISSGQHSELKALFEAYIHDFGERCVGELKLETISYSQNPSLFVKVIQSYVKQGVTEKKSHGNIEEELRQSAENQISKTLNGKPIKRWWFNIVLNKARDLVSNRENLRYERTRGFGMVRHMFSALGNRLHQLGKLDDPRDVFYLELNEIKSLETSDFNENLQEKIQARKAEFAAYEKQEIPQKRFYTYGMNFSDEYIYSTEKLTAIESDLKGIGCCPGRVKSRVRVINHPSEVESLNGEILVTSSTDPGWVTLFPTASGIIVERGSLLSHSAIVSREMGIPCIVGVKGLLSTLKSGDEVVMDGSTGEIKLV